VSKRRTRKEKQSAKYPFITWGKKSENTSLQASVKGQFKKSASNESKPKPKTKNAENKEKEADLALIKENIIKSLILTSLILGSEIVLYLFWR
jgi:hypothetical protein